MNSRDLLFSALYPTLVGKTLILYFGLNWSYHPGEGYGYGFALSVLIGFFLAGRFLWKYRHYED